MGISPTFVRIADVGPLASAFWRVGAALPVLWLWAVIEARSSGESIGAAFRIDKPIFVAGLVFAGDLLFWHLSIVNTTVANATLLSTMAPVWVVIGSGFFVAETVGRNVVCGLAMCVAGAAALIGASKPSPDICRRRLRSRHVLVLRFIFCRRPGDAPGTDRVP
jgi:drug/metabolite transporter (DMT)-like permease